MRLIAPFILWLLMLTTASAQAAKEGGNLQLTGAEISALDTIRIEPSNASGSSAVVIPGDTPLAHTTQVLPLGSTGAIHAPGNAAEQARKVLQLLMFILKEAETGLPQTVRLEVVIAHPEDIAAVRRMVSEIFSGKDKPAVTWILSPLPHPEALVAMSATATTSLPGGRAILSKKSPILFTEHPELSHVSIQPFGARIYFPARIGKGSTTTSATTEAFAQLTASLRKHSLTAEDVFRLNVFVNDIANAGAARDALIEQFEGKSVPPFSIQVSEGPDLVSIAATAAARVPKPDAQAIERLGPIKSRNRDFLRDAPVNFGKDVYFSTLTGDSGLSASAQVEEIWQTLDYLLKKAGSSSEHVSHVRFGVSSSIAENEVIRKANEWGELHFPSATIRMFPTLTEQRHEVTLDVIAVTK